MINILFKRNKIFKEYNRIRLSKNKMAFCYAPFNTLEFHVSGQVRVCCGNRYKIVGNYPNQTIHEIFNGENIQNFRKRLMKYDLSEGCQMCYKMLVNKDYTNLIAKDYELFQTSKKAVLKNIKFELSNECNLECEMCWGELSSSIRENIEKLPKIQSPYGEDFIEQLKPFWKDIEKATFLGGEPFLIKLYYKIWDEIIQNNPDINILVVSNGTILNDKIKQLLDKGKFYFALSIDSFQKETYEKIRRNAVFEKTMSNFEYFYQYSKGNNRWITVNICPMKQNWKEIPEMVNTLTERGVNVFFNMVDFPISHSLRGLKAEQILEVYNYFNTAKITTFDNEVGLQNEQIFKALIKQIKIMYEEIKEYEKSEINYITSKTEAEKYLTGYFTEKAVCFATSKQLTDESAQKIKDSISQLNESEAINGVKAILRIPDYLLVSEIVYTTAEKLAVRLKQSFKNL
jgi:sulfatase maturation enzyme AslB (radical SAM superfamily)